MLYPVELRGRLRAQGYAGRGACWKLDPSLLQHGPDHLRVRHRNRRLTLGALGPRQRLNAELARAGEMLSIPAQQTPGCLYWGPRDHARPPDRCWPEISAHRLMLRIRLSRYINRNQRRGWRDADCHDVRA